jgi:peptidoglycan hydrolase CwlO-like protein
MELKTKLEARLAKLEQDFETGNTELKKQQEQSNQLVSTLMRIQGAISVLEEQLAPEEQPRPT